VFSLFGSVRAERLMVNVLPSDAPALLISEAIFGTISEFAVKENSALELGPFLRARPDRHRRPENPSKHLVPDGAHNTALLCLRVCLHWLHLFYLIPSCSHSFCLFFSLLFSDPSPKVEFKSRLACKPTVYSTAAWSLKHSCRRLATKESYQPNSRFLGPTQHLAQDPRPPALVRLGQHFDLVIHNLSSSPANARLLHHHPAAAVQLERAERRPPPPLTWLPNRVNLS
jgi:hypothetical protein